ncbi:MAG: PAS domain S-box protein, partial [Deltaproteobacteria bacterium]|nr:PAS domain S-box protein [Deltaproteobacteria bacterium]
TTRGLSRVDPSKLHVNTLAPTLVLEEAVLDGVTVPLEGHKGPLVLPPGTRRVQIRYTATSLTAPEKMRVQVRLEGLDRDWIEGGADRTAWFSDLVPGRYRFFARATNNDGLWSDNVPLLELEAQPSFTESLPFRVLIVLGGLALAGAVAAFWSRQRIRRETERMEQERALAQERARSDALLESTSDLVSFCKANGALLAMNPAARRQLGLSLDERVDDKHALDFVVPRERELFWKAAGPTAARYGLWSGETILLARDGREIPVTQVIVAHRGNDGRIEFLSTLARDQTLQKQADEEIRRLNASLEQRVAERTAQLAEANRELDAFSSSVSHDLRAPLRAVAGFAAVLEEDFGDQLGPEGLHLIARVRQAGLRMDQRISGLLQLARLSRAQLRRQKVDLSALAETVVAALAAADPKRVVVVNIEPGLTDDGEAELLRAAFDNLFGNAWKYTARREVAHVRFFAKDVDGDRVYAISDDGAGFDPAHAGKLFGAFQRLHPESEFEGVGLGLATVQRIISRHGGRVWAESKRHEGATFYFTLHPRRDGPATLADPPDRRRT